MNTVKVKCDTCGKEVDKYLGHVNRSKKIGLKFFCNRVCFGISRRDGKSKEQKKIDKAGYDKKYRYYHLEGIKQSKAEAFKKDYAANPEKYKEQRKKRYPKHLEYLRRPEYRAKKKEYDLQYLANKNYGEYAEAALILIELEKHLIQNMPPELKFQMGITNKTQKRKKLWQRTNKNLQLQT